MNKRRVVFLNEKKETKIPTDIIESRNLLDFCMLYLNIDLQSDFFDALEEICEFIEDFVTENGYSIRDAKLIQKHLFDPKISVERIGRNHYLVYCKFENKEYEFDV